MMGRQMQGKGDLALSDEMFANEAAAAALAAQLWATH
jgi:hypothetical protein